MSEVKRAAWAEAITNGDFIGVETYSGYRSTCADPKGKQLYLPVDAADAELGVAVLDALALSRFVTPQEDMSLYDYRLGIERYQEWLTNLIARYGYKSKRALMKNMKNCGIECCDGLIEIRPRHHESLEGWSGAGISKDDYVVIGTGSSPAEIGAALRLAFSRCT